MFKLLFPLTLVLLLNSCNSKNKTNEKKATPPAAIDVSIAKLETYNNTIQANGTIIANEYIEIKPEINGRIVSLNINEGKPVAEGTLLAKIFDDDLQAQLKKYQAQLKIAQTTEQRLKNLIQANGINQQDYDIAANNVNNTQADIDYTKAQIRKTEIRAPFSGIIGLRMISKGAFVSQNTVLASLQQIQQLKVDFVLPENYANLLKTGRKVAIINNNEKLTATIIAIEPLINTATRNIKVRALLNSKKANINPGAFVKVNIGEDELRKAILIPTNCIIPDTRNSKVALIKNGKVTLTPIETGYRSKDKVEIIKGIEVGDTFAINGILFLKPNAVVKIKSVK